MSSVAVSSMPLLLPTLSGLEGIYFREKEKIVGTISSVRASFQVKDILRLESVDGLEDLSGPTAGDPFHAKYMKERLIELPFTVYNAIRGHGLAAVLSNGSGRTVLLRADIDALPLREQTDLPYASTATQVDARDGLRKPTMHACGHDMHATALLAAAETLASARSIWTSTLVLLFQPAEEWGSDARAMVDDGLYEKVPVPDVVLGQHVGPSRAGTVGVRTGTVLSGAESLSVTFHGRGGHGSAPELCIDPVLMAASAVVRLQSVVSREVKTDGETGVVTVGMLQAGEAENIIPDEARMKVNMRSFENATLDRVKRSVRRVIKAESDAGRAVQDPDIKILSQFPVLENDGAAVHVVTRAFEEQFGEEFNPDEPRNMASEDFSTLATSVGKPCVFWFFGGTDQKQWDKAKKEGKLGELPINHSPFFAPVIEPTLKTGAKALCNAALAFLMLAAK
ncbi:MAG: hypothetical protein Q9165_008721 [Trypethelium subeluteriae]